MFLNFGLNQLCTILTQVSKCCLEKVTETWLLRTCLHHEILVFYQIKFCSSSNLCYWFQTILFHMTDTLYCLVVLRRCLICWENQPFYLPSFRVFDSLTVTFLVVLLSSDRMHNVQDDKLSKRPNFNFLPMMCSVLGEAYINSWFLLMMCSVLGEA